jgi:hypothetical protein
MQGENEGGPHNGINGKPADNEMAKSESKSLTTTGKGLAGAELYGESPLIENG